MRGLARVATGIVAIGIAGPWADAAYAADTRVKAPVYKAPSSLAAPLSWTGFYAGVSVGYGWQDRTVTFAGNDPLTNLLLSGTIVVGTQSTPAPPVSFDVNGATGGLQAGYNWQIDPRWIAGLEADISGSAIKGDGTGRFVLLGFNPQTFGTLTAEQKVSWYGTVRARLGWLATDSLLIYGTAGLAYGRIEESAAFANGFSAPAAFGLGGFSAICPANLAPCMVGSSSHVAVGYAAGAGAEYAATRNVNFKVEYLYVNLGGGDSFNVVAQNVAPGLAASSMRAIYGTVDFHTVRVGLNYRL